MIIISLLKIQQLILSKFQNGDLSQRLNVEVDDPNLVKLKSVMNKMAEELEQNIVNVLKVIDEYRRALAS